MWPVAMVAWVAIVAWLLPHADIVPGVRRFRVIGSLVGLLVALVAVAIAITGSVAVNLGSDLSGLSWAIASCLAGLAGGWLMGPAAWRAESIAGWAGVVVRLALVAVIVGAMTIGGMMGIDAIATPEVPLLRSAAVGFAYGVLVLGIIGILVFGIFALPITLVAAAVWALAMRLLRTRLATMPPTSRTSRVARMEPPESGAIP